MLSSALPLLPFSHTTLPKKEWTSNSQEKKGRTISLEAVRQSIFEKKEESETDSDVESKDTREYMSENSWDSDEEYDPEEQAGLLEHIASLLPEKAQVGKPQPKLIKPPPPPPKKDDRPGFFGRQWARFQVWREKERKKRMHHVYQHFEKLIKDYDAKLKKDLEDEIEEIKKEVMFAAYELKKRRAINNMKKKSKKSGIERFDVGIDIRNREAERMAFLCANLQRWSTEKHDQKIEQALLDRAEALEKAEKERKEKEKLDKEAARRREDQELQVDIDITQKIAQFGRQVGVHAGANVFDPVAAQLAKDMKSKEKKSEFDITVEDRNPVLHLRLLPDIDFKLQKRGGVTVDGKKMPVFDFPDLVKTRHVEQLVCHFIGERGALALAAEFVRGACPLIALLDLTRNQIQTRGLGRLLHGMRLANLMSLKHLVLNSNDLTPRAMEYLKDAFQAGVFPALQILDLRNNEIGDIGLEVLLKSFNSLHFEYLRELHLGNNKITDHGFRELMTTLQSLQTTNMPLLERLSLENNSITGKIKNQFSPLPAYLSC